MKDLFEIKELMISCSEMGAANMLKTLQPNSDDLTQNQAFEKFGKAWVLNHKKIGLITGKRKGPAKNSPVYFSRAELLAVRNAEKAVRLGLLEETKDKVNL
jgi:hypothetical protein